jgi:AcrR family transcriptional regulator
MTPPTTGRTAPKAAGPKPAATKRPSPATPARMARPSTSTSPQSPDGKLTRALVLTSALGLIDRDGVDGLSMRRLAAELGRDPMTLYRHAPNKAALLDGVAEAVLAELNVDATAADWAAELRYVAHDYRRLALAHPNVVPLLVTLPLSTPLALRPPGILRSLEDILTLLIGAGFSGGDALHAYRALFGFLHGHVLNELQELVENPDETDDVLRLGLYRLPVGEFPQLRSLAPILASYDGAAELERGLDILLAGLKTMAPTRRRRPGPGARAIPPSRSGSSGRPPSPPRST